MSKPGEDLEKIVEIIERSISPSSKIEQNVFLPVLTSQHGHTAQCDIVIRSGTPPRETLTIVEVQDRNSKVDINTFRGWLNKIDDVGAQHLICVSRKEFPESIKEKVNQSGTKVFLVTLKDLSPEDIPLELIRFIFKYTHIDIKSISNVRPYVAQGQIKQYNLEPISHDYNDKVWSLDKENLISLVDVCKSKVFPQKASVSSSGYLEGSGNLSFNLSSNEQLFYFHKGDFIHIGIECNFEWEFEHAEVPMSIASYEQDKHGSLAWVFEVTHETKNGCVSVKLPIVKSKSRGYELLESVVNSQFKYEMRVIPIDYL